ncbi:enoyl-CoA-hydratase DpgB [Streptomyces sp. NPDC088846]|uniref:enoyl-CoA-hydratase DpgB n=1 Tax=Streptomyces sp. NPDC088846 TaxID=3365908 RepID=UPI0037F86867
MTTTDDITGVCPQLRIDGTQPLSRELIARVQAFADQVEEGGPDSIAVLHLTGSTLASTPVGDVDIALVNKWERTLRRIERLSATTVAVVHGDCGGTALEILLTTDCRLGTPDVLLRLPSGSGPGSAWPGMALYRLANQVGVARIRRATLFDTPVQTTTALELGLLDEIADGLEAAVAIALAITPRQGADVAVRRQLLLEATTTTFEEALGRHLAACDRVLRRSGHASES